MAVRITTWNVNGIRNPFGYQPWRDKRTFDGMFDILEADIVIMQELKIQRKDLTDDMVLVPGWDAYFSLPKHKKGYSGVGIYTRQSKCLPIHAEEGLMGVLCPPGSSIPYRSLPEDKRIGGYPSEEQLGSFGVDPVALDSEGRCVILEFPAFVLFGIYSPANSNGMRDDFRYGFLAALDTRIRNLNALGKRVVVTGDLNVSREEIDTANAEETLKKEGLTHAEYVSTPNRRVFNQLLHGGDVVGTRDPGREQPVLWDTCREMHPTRKGMFTHWEQKINARPANYGSRIDYILCSMTMKDWIEEANIQEGLMGSDHCPVYAVLKEKVPLDGLEVETIDLLNPPGFFKSGHRQKDHLMKFLPPFCARLFNEFDKRRTIKDMFTSNRLPRPDRVCGTLPTGQGDTARSPTGSEFSQSTQNGGASAVPSLTASPVRISTLKRKESNTLPTSTASKRKKSAQEVKEVPSKGQKSLTGFFKPAASVRASSEVVSTSESDMPNGNGSENENSDNVPKTLDASVKLSHGGSPNPSDSAEQAQADPEKDRDVGQDQDTLPTSEYIVATEDGETIIDQVASKATWDNIFTKRAAPLCESHQEPCISLLSKKKGFNNGRYFWICPRPLGPSGAKEVGTQWRCRTFIWASDWTGQP